MKSSKLVHFFYELPGSPVWRDGLNQVILSGVPLDAPDTELHPSQLETTYLLDERSQQLIGQKTLTVPFTDLVEDSVPLPPPKRKWGKKETPTPEAPVQFGQLYLFGNNFK